MYCCYCYVCMYCKRLFMDTWKHNDLELHMYYIDLCIYKYSYPCSFICNILSHSYLGHFVRTNFFSYQVYHFSIYNFILTKKIVILNNYHVHKKENKCELYIHMFELYEFNIMNKKDCKIII